jgi:hypothetical protein
MQSELAARYQALITELRHAKEADTAEKDVLETGLSALIAVKRFLEADPAVFDSGLARPLAVVAAACRNTLQGVRPELFKPRGARRGNVSDTLLAAKRGIIAACYDCLVAGGRGRAEAAQLVAEELERFGVRTINRQRKLIEITPRHVQDWYYSVDQRANDWQSIAFRDLNSAHAEELARTGDTPQNRLKLVLRDLADLRSQGF